MKIKKGWALVLEVDHNFIPDISISGIGIFITYIQIKSLL